MTPSLDAQECARFALAVRASLPRSRRPCLDPAEAERQGLVSGVTIAERIAAGLPVEAARLRSRFARFRSQYDRAVAKGLGPENSKVILLWLHYGGDPMDEQVRR